ncbi:hypothetical protein FRC08_001963 [Ceratobasidium sp. 394]|nr:hypothetical protein FRC08_001963 [Ceratobasidium sp. 394]
MVLFMLGGALQTVAKNMDQIYGGHFVSRLAVAATLLAVPYYITEISPSKHRARTVCAFQALLVAGSLLVCSVSYGFDLRSKLTVAPDLAGTNTTGTTDPGAPAEPNALTSHWNLIRRNRELRWRFNVRLGSYYWCWWLTGRGGKEGVLWTLSWSGKVKLGKEGDAENGSGGTSVQGGELSPSAIVTGLEAPRYSAGDFDSVSTGQSPPSRPCATSIRSVSSCSVRRGRCRLRRVRWDPSLAGCNTRSLYP